MRTLHVSHLQDDSNLPWLTGSTCGASSLTAVIFLLCIGLILGSSRHEEVESETDEVPAICTDIVPRELLLTEPKSAKQCNSATDTASTKVKNEQRVNVVLEWDITGDEEGTVVDIELYSIQKQNGTYRVHSLSLMKDVDNTGYLELPSWTSSALAMLKGSDLLFRIVETSSLNRNSVSSGDLRAFVLVLDQCPTLVRILLREEKPVVEDDQFSFKVNIKPPPPPKVEPKEEEVVKEIPKSQEEDKSLELSLGGNTDSITFQVNSGGEKVSVKVGAKEKSVSLKVDSKFKVQAIAHAGRLIKKPKLQRGTSMSDGFEEIEDYLAKKDGIFYDVSDEDVDDGMVQRAVKSLRSTYELTKLTLRQWKDYAKSRTKQYVEDSCQSWHKNELKNPPSYDGLPLPPCNLAQAISCPHFVPDTACNNGRGYCHFFHRGAYHCIRSVNASTTGAGEQVCYDQSGRLLEFENGGGTFDKAHPEGYMDIDFGTFPPNIKVLKLWRVSHFLEDVWPFLLCCKFSNHCDWYSQVRPTRLYCKNYDIDPEDSRLNHKNFYEFKRRVKV